MSRYDHHSVANEPNEEYLEAVVTPRIDTSPAKHAIVTTTGAVYPDATPLREIRPNEYEDHVMKAKVDAERSKQVRFKGNNMDDIFPQEQAFHNDHIKDIPKQKGSSPHPWYADWFIWTMVAMTMVFVALMGYGFGSGLFLPPNNTAGGAATSVGGGSSFSSASNLSSQATLVDGHDYKDSIKRLLGLPMVTERTSPQARALEWLAFEDEPLFDPSSITPNDRGTMAQRYALVVWYFAQGGPTVWKTLNRDPSSGWIESGAGIHECNWRGIDCDYENDGNTDAGTVIALRLSPALGLVLTGTSLSTELGLLTALRRIDFSDQRLRGKIPDEWMTLTNLETFVLSKNELQSTIPDWIGDWTNLEHLALNGNMLYGTIPSAVGTLRKLTHLELDTNPQLRGRFDKVLFRSLDNGTTTKDSLEYLDLSNTDLEGELPPIILPSIRSLRLWNTRGFGGTLPPQIGSWSNLESFSIKESSKLVGTIPTEFGLLRNLQTLTIQDSNNMSGELPTELGNLSSNLKVINFRYLNQTGTLPTEWSSLKGLERIDLMQNKLEGMIPSEYSKLTSLRFLDLRGTDLTGEVPDGVCALDFEEFLADCDQNNEKTLGKIICVCCTLCFTS